MYISAALPAGGGCFFSIASIHSMPLASVHIGSGPGVAGLSGRQVKPFVPARSSFIDPSAPMSMIAALLPTASGAALMALWILPASSVGAAAGCAVSAVSVFAVSPAAGLVVSLPLHAAALIIRTPNATPANILPPSILAMCISLTPVPFLRGRLVLTV